MKIELAGPVDIARGVAAVAVALTASVHLDVWEVHKYKDLSTMGKLFLLNVVGGFALAVVVLAWRHWLAPLAAAGYGAATLAGFLFTKQFGLFELETTSWDYFSKLSAVYEVIAVAAGLYAAARLWRDRVTAERAVMARV